jgi:hypothetical protein
MTPPVAGTVLPVPGRGGHGHQCAGQRPMVRVPVSVMYRGCCSHESHQPMADELRPLATASS